MASSDTNFSTSPKSILAASFLNRPRADCRSEDDDNLILFMSDFVQELPRALYQRKIHNIEPGAPNDPLCLLFRYVSSQLS